MTRTLWYRDHPIVFEQRRVSVRLEVTHAFGVIRGRAELPPDWIVWPEHQLLKVTMERPELRDFWRAMSVLPSRQFQGVRGK